MQHWFSENNETLQTKWPIIFTSNLISMSLIRMVSQSKYGARDSCAQIGLVKTSYHLKDEQKQAHLTAKRHYTLALIYSKTEDHW
jgi:hypothetical protein